LIDLLGFVIGCLALAIWQISAAALNLNLSQGRPRLYQWLQSTARVLYLYDYFMGIINEGAALIAKEVRIFWPITSLVS